MADPAPQERHEGAGGMPAFSVHKIDLVVAAVIVALCGFLFWDTTNFREVPRSLAQNVPPALFPQLLLLLIIAMALFLPFEHMQKRAQGIDLDKDRSDRIRPITLFTALALLGIVLVMPWLGTFPTLVVACALLPVMWGERRWWLVALYAIAFPLAITYAFVAGLEVNFLPGIAGHLFR
jgi:putative tricarboxylic transport membrane protein